MKKEKDFIRYQGRTVDIHFFKPYDGTKLIVADLVEKNGDTLKVQYKDHLEELPMKEISQIRLHIDF